MRAMLMICLLSVTALAGCTSDGDTDAGVDGGQGIDVGPIDDRVTVQANTSETEPVTMTESGAVAPYQSICVNGCDYDEYSLTAEMEADTAYFVEATLSWTPTAGQFNPVGMSLVWDVGVRDFDGIDYNAGSATFTATLLAAGPSDVYIQVWSNGIPGQGPSAPYDLEVIMTPVSDAIPQYAPAAVTVPEGGALGIESLSGSGRVMVFDGDDALVGIQSVDSGLTVVVDNVTATQEFVIVTMDDIWAKAYVVQDADMDAPELRHIPIVVEWTELGTVNSAGDHSFTLGVDVAPIQVGYRYGANCVPEDCYIAVEATHSMTDPDGNGLFSNTIDLCICGGYNTYVTAFDEGPYPAGDYTIDWTSDQSRGVELYGVSVGYRR